MKVKLLLYMEPMDLDASTFLTVDTEVFGA